MMELEDKLVLIQEECAELIKACAKAQRFGLFNSHPAIGSLLNIDEIRCECIDVLAVIDLFMDSEDNADVIATGIKVKQKKIALWNKK